MKKQAIVGWILVLFGGIFLLVVITRKTVDRETARNLKFIGKFFAASSLLVAVLAVVLAGKGIAGLQEAGWVHTSPVAFPRIDILGIRPTLQTLLAQLAVLVAVAIAFMVNTRSTAPTPKSA